MYRGFFKRFFDVTLSLFGIIVLFPILLIIAIAIKIDSKGPIIFKQQRIGKNKKQFMILKFRTMRVDTPPNAPTHELANPEKWITKVGKFLRKTSLDELPQIFCILANKMSIIGPRPALYNQNDLIDERDKYGANDIKPGLTGWAQINGRDELEISVKARLDGEYVKKLKEGKFKGFLMDWKCFWGTVYCVFKGDGIVEGSVSNKSDQQVCESENNREPLNASEKGN